MKLGNGNWVFAALANGNGNLMHLEKNENKYFTHWENRKLNFMH